ncbi:hypothetical protein CNMCM5793_009383 [Aspergillus hiratsukae]|uniref:Altered inheritance of mitochondria protein 9, mitochondrial n=1 Tax=Aspergillus hiratsukae TaxID=1194566 RepID=A0A8H6PKE4_9EURO|nr:hypothetical protein CNMCM5793_009383 [Aspergillus hiratsukae]KAF7155753.1 hypothetical protein CNMCM6106_007018 [Aspergillus hiratsukae]KAF7155778.1 hypothetical protein CNMCM6106_007043 [Aspergillus hiratsukae]
MDDGNEVIAKIPCPNAGPSSLTTACEVATLNFLRLYTSIRVPEVLAWSSDPANPVGAEYIIMEKIPGVALAEQWETMNTLECYKVIDQIVGMEKELASLQLPAYGSLFLRESVPSEYRHYALPLALDPAKLFCVGPSCDRSMWHKCFVDESKPVQDVGLWTSLSDFALSIPQREFRLIANEEAEVQNDLNCFSDGQSINEYSDLLRKVKNILPILSQDPRVVEVARPVLWHTDLHLGNMFASTDDPTTIEGIIDWQSAQIAPMFIRARFPEFLRPPNGYNPGIGIPSLPDNFEELDPEQKEQAIKDKTLATQSKYYEMSCLAYNKHVYKAMKLDRSLWELFTCCQLFLNGSIVPLRSSLIRIAQDWAGLGLPGSCPFAFPDEVLNMHEERVVRYQDMLYLRDIVKTQLCTDDTGWVPMERWEEANKMNQYLFDMYLETMSEELSPDAAAKTWPFPPPPRVLH